MSLLKIDDEFKNLLPPLTEDEYSQLESDIKKHGVLSPIIAWNEFIIDGHNRYEICQKNGIDLPEVKTLDFANKSDVMDWIINHQTGRRNLTKSQLVKAYASVEEQLKREAKERQVVAGKEFGKGGSKVTSNLTEAISKTPETAEVVAKKIGVSKNTYKGMKQIVSEGTPEQIERTDKGGKGNGVSAIVAEIKEEEANKGVPEGYKKCSRCGTVKPLNEFMVDRRTKNGRGSLCRSCKQEYDRERTGKNPFGEVAKVSQKFASMTMEDIEGDLYERKTIGFDNVVDEVDEVFKACVSSLNNILQMNKEALKEPENSKIIYEKVMGFKEQIEVKANELKNE